MSDYQIIPKDPDCMSVGRLNDSSCKLLVPLEYTVPPETADTVHPKRGAGTRFAFAINFEPNMRPAFTVARCVCYLLENTPGKMHYFGRDIKPGWTLQ